MKVYINGTFFEKEEAKISVFDHGLLYGDGVFEGIRLYQGCVFQLEEHLERLEYSAKALLLDLPWSRSEISEAVCETCRLNELSDGYIRLVITRGIGDLGMSPKLCQDPQMIIIADKIQLYPQEFYESGLKIITVPTRRINPAALPPMVKSLNYLNNILAKIEAQHSGYVEAIMLNDQGFVAECTGDNIFIIEKGVLYTPTSATGALKGITRDAVLKLCKEIGIEYKEVQMTRYDVWNADECFLTGTAAELIPVVELDGRIIGNGKPGTISLQFLEAFKQKASQDGTFI